MRRVYFDNNATTPLLPEVRAAMEPYFSEHFGNASSIHHHGQETRAAVERAEALREADKLKDALLASLSHDLRTPLTTIKGLAHELQPLGDERTLIIEEQADRLNRLVTDLLDVARLDGGALPLDIQVNAADDLLGAVVQHVSGRPDRNRLKVALDDPSSLSLGRFDFVHSLRILANLVDNALKYAPVDTPIRKGVFSPVARGSLLSRLTAGEGSIRTFGSHLSR